MSEEAPSIDPGLEELTSDILGSSPNAEQASDTQEQPVEAVQESQEAQPVPAESAPAPTPPVAPQTIEVDGRQLTLDQVKAALTTREQFPHLQAKYLDAKQKLEGFEKAEAARGQKPLDGKQIQAQVRASFDNSVKEAVEVLGLEADFAELYPGWAANMMLFRDTVTALAGKVQHGLQKLAEYEQQSTQIEQASETGRLVVQAKQNIASLAGEHEALKPLADPAKVEEFYTWIEKNVDPTFDKLWNKDFLIRQWVAYNKDSFLPRADAARAQATAQATARANGRKLAQGIPPTGARPGAVAPVDGPLSALYEMVEDHLERNR